MKKLYYFSIFIMSSLNLFSSSEAIIDNSPLDAIAVNKAINNNDLDFIVSKLKQGLNPDLLLENKITPLMSAINHENVAIIELLLMSGADPNFVNKDGITPLFLAAYVNNKEIIIPMLFNYGAQLDLIDPQLNLSIDEFDYVVGKIKPYFKKLNISPRDIPHNFSFDDVDNV